MCTPLQTVNAYFIVYSAIYTTYRTDCQFNIIYVFYVYRGHLLWYVLNFLFRFLNFLIWISLIRVTSDISTSYTRSNSRNSSLIQANLLLTNGCEKPKQSRKKRGHLFKSQSKTFLYFVHTLKVFLFWHRRHVSVFLDSFNEDADLTIV